MENVAPLHFLPVEHPALGNLQLSICYVSTEQKLFLKLKEGLNFLPKHYLSSGICDPFIRVIVRKKAGFGSSLRIPKNGHRQEYEFQTQIHRKTVNPLFNETFMLDISSRTVAHYTVILLLCDYDRFSRPDVVGQSCIKLKDLDLTKEQDITVEFSHYSEVCIASFR